MILKEIRKKLLSIIAVAALLLTTYSVHAKVKLPPVFSDNMVFQQKTKAAIWGTSDPGKTINISNTWSKALYTSKADELGNWKIIMTTPSYGGPYTINISDGDLTTLNNVLIGDVWFCSGQSNMDMPLAGWGKINNYEQEVKNANYPNIRLLQGIRTTSNVPLDEAMVNNGGWTACTPQYVAEFSSVAYFFAREINERTGVPIGLIHSSWGGTFAEAWTSAAALKAMPDFVDAVKKIENDSKDRAGAKKDENPNRVTVLYNAMIHPYLQFAIKGAIWYQGESNADRAQQYRTLFPTLIKDWRKNWGIGNFPFYFVQLANFRNVESEPKASAWAELRDAQLSTLSLPNTGMAVTIDIGNATDIHPKNKQDVGKRLALIALAKNYNVNIPSSGPIYHSQKVKGNVIELTFKATYGGLKTSDGAALKGFAIAGADQKFYWADAQIKGNKVMVSCAAVPNPVAVRYAWANNPICNLVNFAALPASPFCTDK